MKVVCLCSCCELFIPTLRGRGARAGEDPNRTSTSITTTIGNKEWRRRSRDDASRRGGKQYECCGKGMRLMMIVFGVPH